MSEGHTYNLALGLRAEYDFLGFWAWLSLVGSGGVVSMTGRIAGSSASRSSNLFEAPTSPGPAANANSEFVCVGMSTGNVNTGVGPPNNFQQTAYRRETYRRVQQLRIPEWSSSFRTLRRHSSLELRVRLDALLWCASVGRRRRGICILHRPSFTAITVGEYDDRKT